jgi:hypothetical protein
MKKLFFISIIFLAFHGLANAQELGLRFGNVSAGNIAIDGVFDLSKFNRIHADVSFGNGVGIDALWDFLHKPLGKEALSWYMGAGPYIQIDDPFWLGAAFEAGLEYNFNSVPIVLGFDWRPRLSIIETTDFHVEGFGFNVRYVFGN